MRTLTFKKPYRAAKLYEELVAAIPALLPVDTGEIGLGGVTAMLEVLTIGGDGTVLILGVPDDTDDNAVEKVVEAHDATVLSDAELKEQARDDNAELLRKQVVDALVEMDALAAKLEVKGATADEHLQASALALRGAARLARLQFALLDDAARR